MSKGRVSVVGFSGEEQTLPLTAPLPVTVGGQCIPHRLVVAPQVPVNLLGRDLLVALGASILCGPTGLSVTLPNGQSLTCREEVMGHGQWLVSPPLNQWADVYWGLVEPETPADKGILTSYLAWKPWITLLEPYVPPIDPLHVTLFYDLTSD